MWTTVIRYLRMHKKKVVLTVMASLVIAGLNVSGPYIYGQLVNQAATLTLSNWIIWVVVWSLINLTAIYIERYVNIKKNNLGLECNVDMDIEQFEVKNRLPVLFHSINNSGEVNERITKAGSYLNVVICDVIFALLPDIFTLIVVAFVMFLSVSRTLSLITIAVMLLYIIVTFRAAQKLTMHEKESRKRYKKAVGYMHDIGVNILTVKAYCLENFVSEKLKVFFGDFKQSASLYLGKWADTDFYQKSILSLGSVCILSFAGFIMGQHVINNGQLAMIMVYTSLIFKPFASLSNHYFTMKRAEVSINDGEDLLNEKVESNSFDSTIIREGDDKIEIKNVSYSYVEDNGSSNEDKKEQKGSMIKPAEAVTDLNFEFAPGARLYGIIGPSGCGKTTFMKLLVGFYSPTRGKILFDNIDIKDLASLRKLIVFVESTPLFDGTIEDNIRMDNSKATIIEVMEAAKSAGVHNDIIRRGGYGQSVGPSGLQLSKGEVARIIIARAILNSNEAEVVIFDEPTVNLDNSSIDVIKGTFERLAKDKKVIIVTHDINFVDNAKIIVMKAGRIVEIGSLEEILELNAVGAELYKKQNKNKSKE